MTTKEHYVDLTLKHLKGKFDEVEAIIFLQGQGLTPEEYPEVIEAAKAQWHKEQLPFLSKKYTSWFVLWSILTAIVLYIDFFALPGAVVIGYKLVLCLLGTLALILCCNFLIIYYKTWDIAHLEKRGNVITGLYWFIPLLLPGIVPFFLMMWRFDNAADQSLSEDMVKAKGVIVDGYSLKARRGDIASEVTVQFQTKEGENIITTEDISSYTFKDFYKGQEVNLIYSKKNPRNIDLLTSETTIKNVTQSEEREITPEDLIKFISLQPEDIGASLDKISYGWEMNPEDSSWTNTRKNLSLKANSQNVVFIADFATAHHFPKELAKLGYKATTPVPAQPYSGKPQIFENDLYQITIQTRNVQNELFSVITLSKK